MASLQLWASACDWSRALATSHASLLATKALTFNELQPIQLFDLFQGNYERSHSPTVDELLNTKCGQHHFRCWRQARATYIHKYDG
jgi:hypothetical protein